MAKKSMVDLALSPIIIILLIKYSKLDLVSMDQFNIICQKLKSKQLLELTHQKYKFILYMNILLQYSFTKF